MNTTKTFKKPAWLAVCLTALLVAGCGKSDGEILSEAMDAAMKGCDEGSTAKIEIIAKTWNKGIVFTCEWIVDKDDDIGN